MFPQFILQGQNRLSSSNPETKFVELVIQLCTHTMKNDLRPKTEVGPKITDFYDIEPEIRLHKVVQYAKELTFSYRNNVDTHLLE